MEAGRELDVKVAEALGWKPYLDEDFNDWATEKNGWVPEFSTKWGSMGVLVEEARSQDILLDHDIYMDGYVGCARRFEALDCPCYQAGDTAPHAVSMAFLKLKGVAI
ncbi:hypothetical protein [Brevibacillus parabrevis]|jgi:hypothetical protein|uniref:hypothetical protein n=1 Tax=Brevibacillus parabrevis TaxID=54914 RepID=UPI00248FBD52|nr:hypothetical protein [Brevibacillus parabrevis]